MTIYLVYFIIAQTAPHVTCNDGWISSQSRKSTFPNEFSGVSKSGSDRNVLLIHGYGGYSSAQVILAKPGDQPDIALFCAMSLFFGYISVSSRKDGIWQGTSHVWNRFPFGDWIMKIKITTKEKQQTYEIIFEDESVSRHFSESTFQKGDFYHLKQPAKDVQGIVWLNSANVIRFPRVMPTGGLIVISGRILFIYSDQIMVTLSGIADKGIYSIAIYRSGQVTISLYQEPTVRKFCSSSIGDFSGFPTILTIITMIIERTNFGINLYFNEQLICEFGDANFNGGDILSVRASNFEQLWGISASDC